MPLKAPGKNPPLDDAEREKLLQLDDALQPARPRTSRSLDVYEVEAQRRPYTLEEMLRFEPPIRLGDFMQLLWDDRHAPALAEAAMPSDTHRAIVLLAGCGRHDEARALYGTMDEETVWRYPHGGAHAAMAAGDFEVPGHREVRCLRMSALGVLVRFRPLAERLAASADTLLARLPEFFAGNAYQQKFVQIWTPVLKSFALLSATDEDAIDKGFAAHLAELAGVSAKQHESFTPEDKRAALRAMFTLAMHKRRLVIAHRIAGKFDKSKTNRFRVLVAVEYAKAGDLGGAWEIVRKLPPQWLFEHLAQTARAQTRPTI